MTDLSLHNGGKIRNRKSGRNCERKSVRIAGGCQAGKFATWEREVAAPLNVGSGKKGLPGQACTPRKEGSATAPGPVLGEEKAKTGGR